MCMRSTEMPLYIKHYAMWQLANAFFVQWLPATMFNGHSPFAYGDGTAGCWPCGSDELAAAWKKLGPREDVYLRYRAFQSDAIQKLYLTTLGTTFYPAWHDSRPVITDAVPEKPLPEDRLLPPWRARAVGILVHAVLLHLASDPDGSRPAQVAAHSSGRGAWWGCVFSVGSEADGVAVGFASDLGHGRLRLQLDGTLAGWR
jgi:hypothetical protein